MSTEPNPLLPPSETAPEGSDILAAVIDGPDEADRPGQLAFPVVGIGASAGGLEAFTELFQNLPGDTGMAYIVIQHMPSGRKSMLSQILARVTPMPVVEAEEGMPVLLDHVYVIPAGKRIRISGGNLQLEERPDAQRTGMPIDVFFRSLAADQGSQSVAVVLSGMDSDGSLGLRAVKGEGGVAMAQDAASARFVEMPRSAVASDHVDFVLPPAGIATELARIGREFKTVIPVVAAPQPSKQEQQELDRIIAVLRQISGTDFSLYKQTTLRRRIARRMIVQKFRSLHTYREYLSTDPVEVRDLHEDILINYTRFFRDTETFEAVRTDLIPAMLKKRTPESPIRIWAAGCATGEEVYSIAICLLEALGTAAIEPVIQIFGTDLSEHSIDRARQGVYPDSLVNEISPERLRRFFIKCDKGYQVIKRVRDMCVFARQNLANDPPFSRLDLISCRNVLIYFGAALQNSVLATFHYSLNPEGYLMLGNSESIRSHTEMFQQIEKRSQFYRKNATNGHLALEFMNRRLASASTEGALRSQSREGSFEIDLQRAADRAILARYGPPSVVIDENFDVLQSRGDTSPFLHLGPGTASLNLMKLAREGLRVEMRDAVRRAISQDVPVQVPGLQIENDGAIRELTLEVLPIQSLSSKARRFLVTFVPKAAEPADGVRAQLKKPPADESLDEKDRRIRQIDQDLSATKLYLQSLVEERESRNHDLVIANEEIESSNEELQSINEELETAKEELQSTNEELQTVNEELRSSNAELGHTTDDLRNVLNSTTIPIIMLDRELRIRQITSPAERLMNLRLSDIGRPIREIRLELSLEDLEPMLRDVLDNLNTRETEVQDRNGRWHLLRARPYRTVDNRIDGVVLLLMDIDDIRRSQHELIAARNFVAGVIESVQVPLVVLRTDMRVAMSNKAFEKLSGLPASEIGGKPFPDVATQLWKLGSVREPLERLMRNEPESGSIELEHEVAGGKRFLCLNAQAIKPDGERAVLVSIEDITSRKEAERLLKREKEVTAQELDRTKEELRALAASLFTAQEEERRRVARELHDDLSQKLAMLEVGVQRVEQEYAGQDAGLRSHLVDLRNRVEGLSNDLRRISHQLHPGILDDLGLPTALRALAHDFASQYGMAVRFSARAVPKDVPSPVANGLYRVAQEALRNVSKHAGQTPVRMTLTGGNRTLRLSIRDWGVGFDPKHVRNQGGLGLISIEERVRAVAGTVEVESKPGEGVNLIISVPLP